MYDVTTAKLFLLDMDGTFYLDDTLLPGALEFLALCRATGRQFAFLTNNSSKSKADYLATVSYTHLLHWASGWVQAAAALSACIWAHGKRKRRTAPPARAFFLLWGWAA